MINTCVRLFIVIFNITVQGLSSYSLLPRSFYILQKGHTRRALLECSWAACFRGKKKFLTIWQLSVSIKNAA